MDRVIAQLVKLGAFAFYIEVFGDPNVFFCDPAGGVVTRRSLGEVSAIVCVWVMVAENLLIHNGRNKALFSVRSVWQY